ncbi:MAG TPA: hypothetical protein VMR31_05375 [Myxococcota bacterium]|nr:hypothetical protein [Myxococcota bacterium]
MRRKVVLAALALAALAVVGRSLRVRHAPPAPAVALPAAAPEALAVPAPSSSEPASAPAPVGPVAAAPRRVPIAEPADATRSETELRALEDQALRRIDVGPLLENAGIDVAKLRARPDGDDVLRHVAGDELLVRAFMRDLLSLTVYPYGYPEDRALADARSGAEKAVAKLSPEDRANTLARALEGPSDLPAPIYATRESGQVWDGHLRGEAASN